MCDFADIALRLMAAVAVLLATGTIGMIGYGIFKLIREEFS